MQLEKTPIKDLVLLRPRVFADNRGFFLESYNKRTMTELGIKCEFVHGSVINKAMYCGCLNGMFV
jgi:dTDP-4-dehydrorhamnose 3,5-epimerase